MLFRSALTTAVLLMLTTPSWAQDPAPVPASEPTAPSAYPEPELSPEIQALRPDAEAFQAMVPVMIAEIAKGVAADAGVGGRAESDAAIARYQPQLDAFASKVETAANAEAARISDETAKAAKLAEAAQAVGYLRGMGGTIRDQIIQQSAAAGQASSQPSSPTPTPR